MRVPISKRVAGSDIFEALKSQRTIEQPLRIFFFGARDGVAERACTQINNKKCGLICVGSLFPGFGTIEEFSQDHVIEQINSSAADFLVASLGAEKGQLWLVQNSRRLQVPVRAHLGAVVGFQAGEIQRAPRFVRKLGLEWVWRIKEEPMLWTRYWRDGCVLLRLLLTRVLPIVIETRWLSTKGADRELVITGVEDDQRIVIRLSGSATTEFTTQAVACFRNALATNKKIVIDFSETQTIDARFFGLLLMLRKELKIRGETWKLIKVSPGVERLFRLNELAFLICAEAELWNAGV